MINENIKTIGFSKWNLWFMVFVIYFYSIETANAQIVAKDSPGAITTFNNFREPSAIFIGSGLGNMEPLIFEGDLIPYFMLSINKNVRWGVELSPRIIMRMYNTDSYPVRTPSFMPRFTFFYQLIDNENKKRDLFTYFSLFHHSNGQDGNFYLADGHTINTKSGNFSANWLEAGAFFSRPDQTISGNINYFKLYAAYDISQEENLDGVYGRLRLFGDFKNNLNVSNIINVFRKADKYSKVLINQSLKLGWIAGYLTNTKELDKKRLIFQYTLSYEPLFMNNVNLFVQYYYGQDYYNIYFNRTLNVIRFGIASKI
ncbi:MAG: hypothetical protein PF517_12950 [Salinivirgaceae bacterium]|jgi:hypothetical protein|nr:hypothetical protein [Salinivirgaceae bacterium]